MAVAGDGQHGRADGDVLFRIDRADRTADHHAHEIVLGDIGNQPLADHRSVAKHGVAIGDAEDLVELVADEQDGLAVRLQPFDQRIEFVNFLVRERRRRLVHDDDAGVDR
ncbi:hypothetical protein D9M69_710790 [compost metagenome]